MEKRRVLLVCIQSLLSESLQQALGRVEDIELIGPWDLDRPVLAKLREETPDIVIVVEGVKESSRAAELGYSQVIAIVPEPGTVYRDLFQSATIPASWASASIHVIQPVSSLGELGVDCTTATPNRFDAAHRHGEERGASFVRMFRR